MKDPPWNGADDVVMARIVQTPQITCTPHTMPAGVSLSWWSGQRELWELHSSRCVDDFTFSDLCGLLAPSKGLVATFTVRFSSG